MKERKYFKGWALDFLTLAYDRLMPKLLTVQFNFVKLEGYEHSELQKELWSLKQYPEQFKQFLPPRARYKLEVQQYDEKFYIEPENVPFYTLQDSRGTVTLQGSKTLQIGLYSCTVLSRELQQERYGNAYSFSGDAFAFRFKHSVSGKEPSDRLYQMTKDWTCTFGGDGVYKYNQEYTGKFCSRPFIYSELVLTLVKSMDRQFDFIDSNAQRLAWYEELRAEVLQPTIVLKPAKEPTIDTFWMGDFYNVSLYPGALATWEARKMDYLLGEEESIGGA